MLWSNYVLEYLRFGMRTALRIRDLEVLLAVAAAGSMQRAAQRAHLTQPAISKIVRELEASFGTALFERSKRGVSLTESGRALAERAQYLLNDIESTRDELAAIDKGTVGALRIGVLPVVESTLLPKGLQALRKIAPALRIRIEEGARAALLGSLRRGELDCVIGRLDVGSPDAEFHCEGLVRLPVRIVSGVRHPLAQAKRITLTTLTAYPWVLPPPGAPIRCVIDSLFVHAGIAAPLPLVESTSIRLNYELIRTSDMIGTMTEDAAAAYAGQRKLAILPIELGDRLPDVGTIMRRGRVSNATALFLRVLRESCG
jgi:DNA-binding transcriptional LysR family regulator